MGKKWYLSKTVILALLQAAAGLLAALGTEFSTVGWIVTAKSAIDIILRFYTKEPMA